MKWNKQTKALNSAPELAKQILDLFSSGLVESEPAEYMYVEDIQEMLDTNDTVDGFIQELEEYVREENAEMFNQELIYYVNAMKYLSDNDPSLYQCMEIAEEHGYQPKDLNSEMLASMLATRKAEDEFSEVWPSIVDGVRELLALEEE